MRTFILAALLPLALAACNSSGGGAPAKTEAGDQVYSGTGTITAVAGDRVSISHGPIQGIGWPAMTMTFGSGGKADGFRAGDRVGFSFRRSGQDYVLTALSHAS